MPKSSALQLLPGVVSAETAAAGERLVLTVQQVQIVHDSIMRATSAAEQAERLCAAASRAFAQEASNLKACGVVVQGFLRG